MFPRFSVTVVGLVAPLLSVTVNTASWPSATVTSFTVTVGRSSTGGCGGVGGFTGGGGTALPSSVIVPTPASVPRAVPAVSVNVSGPSYTLFGSSAVVATDT